MTGQRYRWTAAQYSVGVIFGALSASALTGTVLVRLLRALHIRESAARNVLATMRARGLLTVERVGRQAVYRMAFRMHARYQEIEGTAEAAGWSGSFHGLIYDIPERHRSHRDRFRYLTGNAGYGLLRPGVLISVGDRLPRVRDAIGDLPDGCRSHPVRITPQDLPEARAMANHAWQLDELAAGYAEMTGLLARTAAELDAEPVTDQWRGLVLWDRVYRQMASLQMSDPRLPPELLPAGWPDRNFWSELGKVNDRLGPRVQPALRDEARRLDPAGLCEFHDPPAGPATERAPSRPDGALSGE